MKAICKGCGEMVEFRDIPAPKIFNDPHTSVLVSHHERFGFCLKCKTKVALAIEQVQLVCVALPIAEKYQSPIVLAPASALPKA